jgi:predicted short-subunit dehydrogenase-like oxidoreductase (DUF2520 family)
MDTLNIIGAGRVGRTLARLWRENGVFEVQDVLDRTAEGAHAAIAFIGGGRQVREFGDMRAAAMWMVTPPDSRIVSCCEALAASCLLRSGDIVFHCSGSLASLEMAGAARLGACVASVHPLKSFAEPAAAAASFAGTWCAAEGNSRALEILRPAFERIGAKVTEIAPEHKTLYHAASVIACNYLVALVEVSVQCYERAGITREVALEIAAPLVRETADNVFRLGTAQALTGPIARGDYAVVMQHLGALKAWDPDLGDLYRRLGAVALDLSRKQGEAGSEALARLAELLLRR